MFRPTPVFLTMIYLVMIFLHIALHYDGVITIIFHYYLLVCITWVKQCHKLSG